MTVRRVVTGSVLAAGLGVAGLLGAGAASAAPGISIDPGTGGTNPIEIGDTSAAGAQAIAKPGNTAVAVSIFGPSYADASKGGSTKFGEGNNVVTFGSVAKTGPDSAGNNVLGLGGSSDEINGQHDNVLSVAGDTTTDKYSHQNNIVNVAGVVVSEDQYTKPVYSAPTSAASSSPARAATSPCRPAPSADRKRNNEDLAGHAPAHVGPASRRISFHSATVAR